jgi:hypothetical protein
MINRVRGKEERSTEKREVKNKRWSEMQKKECCIGKSLTEYRKRMNKKNGKGEEDRIKRSVLLLLIECGNGGGEYRASIFKCIWGPRIDSKE